MIHPIHTGEDPIDTTVSLMVDKVNEIIEIVNKLEAQHKSEAIESKEGVRDE